ncbi:MAG: DUF4097 family beta strand repeat protein [Clostridia bacterium]|nr:DUF4097 family beta strand repeat protein [Clostridia bacterium]
MKKGLIIAVILTALGLALIVGALAAAGFDLEKFDMSKYETNTYTVNEEFDKIELDLETEDVTFRLSDDGKLRVVCFERENGKHSVSAENGTLTIKENDERKWYDYLTFFGKSLYMTVYLPSDHYESLKIDASTGDVTIPKDFSFGSIDIDVSTGDVLCAASAAGEIKIKTSTGKILLDGANADDIDLSASTGDVTLNSTVALKGFNIKTSTGDVTFDGSDAAGITVKTSTGDVEGTLASEKVFVVETSTGTVVVPNSVSGGRCEVKTSTGDVKISISGN